MAQMGADPPRIGLPEASVDALAEPPKRRSFGAPTEAHADDMAPPAAFRMPAPICGISEICGLLVLSADWARHLRLSSFCLDLADKRVRKKGKQGDAEKTESSSATFSSLARFPRELFLQNPAPAGRLKGHGPPAGSG